ncbi:MAG: 1-acyl-sn-glycerol-3-phosphate acyltransferase [Bacteriovoracaceae bacterium]|nr:1-acyl-sn-glycerol-3-phosphate acyltransferase [Bacteriovoracaceae bacterium]
MEFTQVLNTVLSYPKLSQRLIEKPAEKEQAAKLLKEIAGDFSPKLVDACIKFIDATFARLYDGVSFDVPENFDLKKLSEENHVILVPNHQSHADYIALTYVVYGVYSLPIYIAGGINLNVFPIGSLFRKTGAFFIRRTFSSDILYKLVFEAYVYSLLKNGSIIEFFFEGGRSRTGKLLKPKYGLFQMLLEAHKQLDDKKPLMFIPVTLAHEQVPEARSHAKELFGAKKKQESTSQLLKIFKIFNRQLGTIHVRFSPGIVINEYQDLKSEVQNLAFDCFGSIAKAMPITPTAMISLVMLNEATGALTWEGIEERALKVLRYCRALKIPLSNSLNEEKETVSLKHALEIMVENGKIDSLYKENLGEIYFHIVPKARVEILYFKNMIIHHFLIPGIMNSALTNLFNGTLTSTQELRDYITEQRLELKYEFYLPSVKEMFLSAMEIVNLALDEKVSKLDDILKLSKKEIIKVANIIKPFSTAFIYLDEAYYLGAAALDFLHNEEFSKQRFINVARELFELEREHGRVVKYHESYTVPVIENVLTFFINLGAVEKNEAIYKVVKAQDIKEYKDKFAKDIHDQLSMTLNE